MKEFTKNLIAFGVFVIIFIIVIIVLNKKEENKLNKFTFTNNNQEGRREAEECFDTCFDKYPYNFQGEKRQNCMDDCIDDNEVIPTPLTDYKVNDDWRNLYQRCVHDTCGDKCLNGCDELEDKDKRMECRTNCRDCPFVCCLKSKGCNEIYNLTDAKKCVNSCKMITMN